MVPGRGTTATVIVESGTLKVGMPFICGPYSGKVRSLINDRGVAVKSAHPGMPASTATTLVEHILNVCRELGVSCQRAGS